MILYRGLHMNVSLHAKPLVTRWCFNYVKS